MHEAKGIAIGKKYRVAKNSDEIHFHPVGAVVEVTGVKRNEDGVETLETRGPVRRSIGIEDGVYQVGVPVADLAPIAEGPQVLAQLQPQEIAERFMKLDPEKCEFRGPGDILNDTEGALFIRRLRDELIDAIIETPHFVDVVTLTILRAMTRDVQNVWQRRYAIAVHAVGEDRKAAARAWFDLGLYAEESDNPWDDHLEDVALLAVTNICKAIAAGEIERPA